MVQIGMVTLGMGAAPLSEVLEVAVATGSEVMELNGRPTVHQNLWAEPIDYTAIQAQIGASGVAVSSLGGYWNPAQLSDEALAEEVEQFVGYCTVAREMGIPVVRAFAGDVMEGYTLDDFYPRIVAGFKAVTERVANWGITVGIENHGRLINDGDRLKDLFDDVASPVLGMTIDTGNFCWAGHSLETAHRYFDVLAPYTVNVHVKDGRFEDGEWVLYPVGRGDIDLPGLFDRLDEEGYDGPIVSEYEGKCDFRLSTLESVAYLRGLRDAFI